jgi:hypothetical protein
VATIAIQTTAMRWRSERVVSVMGMPVKEIDNSTRITDACKHYPFTNSTDN